MTDKKPTGRWQYAVRELEEDGTYEGTMWTSHSIYSYEPFASAEDARSFAEPFLNNFEIVRAWLHAPIWEIVPEPEMEQIMAEVLGTVEATISITCEGTENWLGRFPIRLLPLEEQDEPGKVLVRIETADIVAGLRQIADALEQGAAR